MSVNVVDMRADKVVINRGVYGGSRALFIEPVVSVAGEPAVKDEMYKHLPLDGGTVLMFYDKASLDELIQKLEMVRTGFELAGAR